MRGLFRFYLEELDEPLIWSIYGLVITHDGYTEDGIRVHVVKDLEELRLIANAICIPEIRLHEYIEEK